MKTRHVLFVLIAAGLVVGCDKTGRMHRGPNPEAPKIELRDGRIVLDQEVILLPPGSNGPVTWSLPAQSAYRFADRGIVIEGRIVDEVVREPRLAVVLEPRQTAFTNCRRSEDRLQYTCDHRYSGPAAYKYTIRLMIGERVVARDPLIVEM